MPSPFCLRPIRVFLYMTAQRVPIQLVGPLWTGSLVGHAARLQPVDYGGVREELAAHGVEDPTPTRVAEAVRRLRRRKLPDPAAIGNAGSFFKNPVVDDAVAAALALEHDGLPVHPSGAGRSKLSAAWLIEHAGLKGYRAGAAGVSAQHALVLVNHGGASGAELLAVARHVAATVESRYGVRLEPEPRIVGATF